VIDGGLWGALRSQVSEKRSSKKNISSLVARIWNAVVICDMDFVNMEMCEKPSRKLTVEPWAWGERGQESWMGSIT